MLPSLRYAVLLPMLAAVAVAQTQPPYKKDQKIEVREGDVWSPATVLEQEGRRVHVKYDDGTDEWVPLPRARAAAAKDPAADATTGTPATNKTPATQPAAKPPEEKTPLAGRCEIKWASRWLPGVIKNRDGDLYLVMYDGWENRFHWAWVSGDCVRPIGGKKVGPSNPESVTVANQGVEKAKAQAKQDLPKWKAAYTQDLEDQQAEMAKADAKARSGVASDRAEAARARAEAQHGKAGAFEPAAYDKPIVVAKNTNVPAQTAKRSAASTYTPEPVAETATADPIAVVSGDFGGFRDNLLAAGAFVAAVQSQGRDLYTVQLLDLAAGTVTDAVEFDPLSRPFALSTDGKILVGRSDNFFGGTKLRLDFFDVTPTELKHRLSFEPYGTLGNKNERDVTFAAVTNGTLVTSNTTGDLAGWTMSTSGEPAVTCKWKSSVGGKAAALSPNGKTVAVARADGLFLVDAMTGATQAFIAATRESDRLTFTPDGKWVVGIDGPVLTAYDLVAGRAAPDVGLPPGVFGRSVVGVGPTHVLLDSKYLFDLERHAVTWQYDDAADAVAACGRAWARVGKGAARSLVTPARLPDAAARRAAVAAAEPLFKAGDSISLDISVEADAKQQQSIRDHFTNELQRIGVTVADGRPVRLVVRTENGKSTQERWERMGGAPWNRESADVTVTDKISSVMIESAGKMAWQMMTTARVGGAVSSKDGQGIAESVQAANQFNVGFFTGVKLPTFVPKPRTPIVAGSTAWAAAGDKK